MLLRLFFSLVMLLFFSCSLLEVPPEITHSTPVNGAVSVEIDSSIEIIFSHKMNKNSVEDSFTLEVVRNYSDEVVDGNFIWTDDKSFRFTPFAELLEGNRYKIFLSRDSENISGRDLTDDQEIIFDTVGSNISFFRVLSSSPGDGEVISNMSHPIYFSFSTEIELADFVNAFSISPSVSFSYFVSNGDIVALPIDNFTFGALYALTFDSTLRDIYGNPIDEQWEIHFQVGSNFIKPQLLSVHSSTVSNLSASNENSSLEKSDSFFFVFNKPIDRESIKRAFVFSDNVSGDWYFSDLDKRVVYTPHSDLESEGLYFFTIKDSLSSVDNNILGENFTYHIRINGPCSKRPQVVAVQANDGSKLLQGSPLDLSTSFIPREYQGFKLVFDRPLNEKSLYTSITSSFLMGQNSTGIYIKEIELVDGSNVIIDFGGLYDGNTYKITVDGGSDGLMDIYSNFIENKFEHVFNAVE